MIESEKVVCAFSGQEVALATAVALTMTFPPDGEQQTVFADPKARSNAMSDIAPKHPYLLDAL